MEVKRDEDCKGYRFNSIEELNHFIEEEAWRRIRSMSKEDLEKLLKKIEKEKWKNFSNKLKLNLGAGGGI